MDSSSLIWTALLFAGLAQGLFLSAVLATSRRGGPSRLLALLTLVLSLMLGEELIDALGFYSRWPHLALSTFSLPLAIGPLLYLYALRSAKTDRGWRPKDALHFLPVAVTTLPLLSFYRLNGRAKLEALDGEPVAGLGLLVLFKGAHVLAYELAALRLCGRALRSPELVERKQVIWFRRMLAASLAPVAMIHVLYFYPDLAPPLLAESDRFGSLIVATIIYSFAWAAMKRHFDAASPQAASKGVQLPAHGEQPKYRNSALDETEKRALLDALLVHMERERSFRDPELRLDDVAEALEVSPHALSQVINELAGVNFYAFVNRYRVQATEQMMADPAHHHRTLLALAFDAGFNSKTSFNRVFRERTGTTPSERRKQLQRESGTGISSPERSRTARSQPIVSATRPSGTTGAVER